MVDVGPRFDQWLCRTMLPGLLAKRCGEIIPRSWPEGADVNCFSVSLRQGDDPDILLTGVFGATFTGLRWDGNRFSEETEVSLADLSSRQILIRHYYGLDKVTYSGIRDLAWTRILPWPYAVIYWRRLVAGVRHAVLSRRDLKTWRSIDVLREVRARTISRSRMSRIDPTPQFDAFEAMEWIHGAQWIEYANHEAALSEMGLILESLVARGSLVRDGQSSYRLVPGAIAVTEAQDLEDARDHDAAKYRSWKLWAALMTLVIALLGLLLRWRMSASGPRIILG